MHPSLRAARAHRRASEVLSDGTLSCGLCRNRTPHGTLSGYTNWRCRCTRCKVANTDNMREYLRVYPDRAQQDRSKWSDRYHAFKIGSSCVDCGLLCTWENFPVFDWDHRPGTNKVSNVSILANNKRSAVEAEIAKCDLRCANCHRLITWQRNAVKWEVQARRLLNDE